MEVRYVTFGYSNSTHLNESNVASPVQGDASFVKGMERICTHTTQTHEENRKAKKQIADRMRTNPQERKGAFHLLEGIFGRKEEASLFLSAAIAYWARRNVAFLRRGDGLQN